MADCHHRFIRYASSSSFVHHCMYSRTYVTVHCVHYFISSIIHLCHCICLTSMLSSSPNKIIVLVCLLYSLYTIQTLVHVTTTVKQLGHQPSLIIIIPLLVFIPSSLHKSCSRQDSLLYQASSQGIIILLYVFTDYSYCILPYLIPWILNLHHTNFNQSLDSDCCNFGDDHRGFMCWYKSSRQFLIVATIS